MTYAFDPEFADALATIIARAPPAPLPRRGDWQGVRDSANALLGALADSAPIAPEAKMMSHSVAAADGSLIDLRWYTKTGASPGPAVLYVHGGGMICGNLDVYHAALCGYVAATGVSMLAVEYRLAPEHPHPTPVEDSFTALRWLFSHAESLGLDRTRIAVMGDSAGGGIAAGVALLARDRGLPLARQILIYPMLDDRNTTPDPALAPFATWSYDNNFTGWHALLGASIGTATVPESAAPLRAATLAGVAPAYVEVGELDIFRDEDIEYASRIARAGISVELHVHPGVPHAFDGIAPQSAVAKRAYADRVRVLMAL